MNVSCRGPKALSFTLATLVCLATLICAARAEAFSDAPQAQSPLALGVSDPDQTSNPALITDNSRDLYFMTTSCG